MSVLRSPTRFRRGVETYDTVVLAVTGTANEGADARRRVAIAAAERPVEI